jgi:hypothetical protein
MSLGRRWLILVGVWLVVALFACAQIYVARAALGEPPPLWPLLRLEVPVWAFWIAASVGIIMLSRQVPLDRRRLLMSVATHLVAAIAIATAFVTFKMVWYQAFNPYPFTDPSISRWFWRGFREWFILGFVIYWAIVGVYHAFANYARFRDREADLAVATLQALRSQLHPHFLFNALNTVSAVLEVDPRLARRLLGQLGDLLRASLQSPANDETRLARDLELLAAYVEIERARFGARLQVDLAVDPGLEQALVPSFLLQPLVENAIRHGIAPREQGGRVLVRVGRVQSELHVSVDDDGVGSGPPAKGEGVGLGNTRRRLVTLYGTAASLRTAPSVLGGFAVELRFPFRTSSHGAAHP